MQLIRKIELFLLHFIVKIKLVVVVIKILFLFLLLIINFCKLTGLFFFARPLALLAFLASAVEAKDT